MTSVQERVEQSLGERLALAGQSLAHAQERERVLGERVVELSAREATSSEGAMIERARRMEAEARLEEVQERLRGSEDRRLEERQELEAERGRQGEELAETRREKEFLAANLATESAESEVQSSTVHVYSTEPVLQGRRKKCLALMEQLKERDRRVKELQVELETRIQGGRNSVASLGQSASPSPSHLSDTSWMPGTEAEVSYLTIVTSLFIKSLCICQVYYSTPASSLYDAARFGTNAAMMESMGAQLKQKEGELIQLQVLLSEQSKVKETMTNELTRLTILAEQVRERIEQIYQTGHHTPTLLIWTQHNWTKQHNTSLGDLTKKRFHKLRKKQSENRVRCLVREIAFQFDIILLMSQNYFILYF